MEKTYNIYEMITATLISYSLGYIFSGIGIALDELQAYLKSKRNAKKEKEDKR